MKNFLTRSVSSINSFLIRISRGRIGTQLGSQTILLLESTGRKSGKHYITPIAYFDYEEKYLLIASNWGRDKEADWFLNLIKHPRATIEARGQTISVEAHAAEGEEYAQLWKFATERHPPYLKYQKMTSRSIPIVVLDPVP